MKTIIKVLFLRLYSFITGICSSHIALVFFIFSSTVSMGADVGVLSITNNSVGDTVSFRAVVLAVDRDGLSGKTYRVKLHDLVFCSVALPPAAKWVGGKLTLNGRPVFPSGTPVVVSGVLTKRLSKYYIDPASIALY